MRANFGDFGIFCHIDFKILKKFVTRVRPYWDQFWKILAFAFGEMSKVHDKPPWHEFSQNFVKFYRNWKFWNFRVKDFKFWIWQGHEISNFGFQKQFCARFVQNFLQIWQKIKIPPRILSFKDKFYRQFSPKFEWCQNFRIWFVRYYALQELFQNFEDDSLRIIKISILQNFESKILQNDAWNDFVAKFNNFVTSLGLIDLKILQILSARDKDFEILNFVDW